MQGLRVDELRVWQSAGFSKTITEADVCLFAGITGDMNPAHINEAYAVGTKFKGRIAHGMLSAGLISTVLGMYLPGPWHHLSGADTKIPCPRPHWGYHHGDGHGQGANPREKPRNSDHQLCESGRRRSSQRGSHCFGTPVTQIHVQNISTAKKYARCSFEWRAYFIALNG